jgi:hypothetical protein
MLTYLLGVLSGLLFAVLIILFLIWKYLLDTPDSSGKSKLQKQVENQEFDKFGPNTQKEVFSDEAVIIFDHFLSFFFCCFVWLCLNFFFFFFHSFQETLKVK